ncbi:Delta endotoxin [Beauveria brongniartii RCEF 3172]|uniref:Delta endotoxin n=1 Tax=Beauveria brongniartii RCEF 3172 TaxID=1081107 RepID=A0A166XRS1_9HYPO|nr:Delta endotoxin [Beauveria brongniartii RCEF 3172]
MKVDVDSALDFANAALTAAKDGVALDITDSDEIFSYMFSIFSIGVGLVPGAGPLLSSFCGLLGAIAFPKKTTDLNAIWNSLRERVETLIGAKIQASHVYILQKNVEGFASNMKAFTRVLNDYEQLTGDDKAKQGETLRTHFIAFLAVLRAGIPAFQVNEYAVASLPLFTQAANIHLTLLSDGIRNGEAWGFIKNYRNRLQQEFDELTVSSSKRIRAALRDRDEPSQLDAIKECIAVGEAAGWDAELIDTWKAALETLSKATALSKRATLTYPAYAKQYYEKGRTLIKPYTSISEGSDKGLSEALALNALSDYDATMFKNVLTYVEFWPYLTGKEMPESAKLALDREIFFGPYGRYTGGATWNAKNAPPITTRGSNITAIKVRSWDDVDAVQVQYGGHWGPLFGDANGGAEHQANLAFDEYIQSIDVLYGQKLGQLTFFSNKDKTHGWYGNGVHTRNRTSIKHQGYGLTSMVVTHWEKHVPPGCEGIIFGFRPLLTARG